MERFWSKVDIRGPDECWPWLGGAHRDGRGTFNYNGRMTTASRVAWMLTHGIEIPSEIFVCHSCDNPPCCNPAHLWPGTRLDNMRDMIAKGRAANMKLTHCKNGHPFDKENTRFRGAMKQQRVCVICQRNFRLKNARLPKSREMCRLRSQKRRDIAKVKEVVA